MISTQGLAALRIAATLVHGVPRLRIRIRGGEEVVADIGWSVVPAGGEAEAPDVPGASAVAISPCGFREAVARAHRLHEQGQRLAFLDLAPGCDPAIDVGLPEGGTAFAGGIYRVPLDGRWLFAFATTLDAVTCRGLGADLVGAALPLDMLVALGVRGDEDTEVSLVYAETSAQLDDAGHLRVVDLLQSMLARFTAHELIDEVTRPEVRPG